MQQNSFLLINAKSVAPATYCNTIILKELFMYNYNKSTLKFQTDPLSMSPQKALETVGNKLQEQYERWQPRVRSIFM